MSDLSDDKIYKIINSIILDKNECVTLPKLTEKLKISMEKCNDILLRFVLEYNNGLNLNNLIILFSADVEKDNKLETILIPSYSESLDFVLRSPSLIRLNIHSIQSKRDDFLLSDYSVYSPNLDLRVNSEPIETKFANLPPSAKKNKQKQEAETNNNKSKSNGAFNSSKDAKQPNGTNKDNNDIKSGFKNMELNISKSQTEKEKGSSNNNLNSVSIAAKNDKKENSKKKNIIEDEDIIQENPEQEYFYGGQPRNTIINKESTNTNANIDIDNNSSLSHLSEHNNVSKASDKDGKRKKDTKKDTSPSKTKALFNKQQNEISNTEKGNEKENNGTNADTDDKINENKESKKIRKVRKVKKSKSYMDKDGYFKTIDEWEEEVYYVDEEDLKQKSKSGVNNSIQPDKNVQKRKQPDKTQGSIMSFFK